MPPACSPDELFAYLDSLGIAHQTVTHPPMFKVEDGRTLRDRVAGEHTKNLFLRDKKGVMFLVVAPAQAAIELKSLHRLLGASLLVRVGRVDARDAGCRARLDDAVCRDQ